MLHWGTRAFAQPLGLPLHKLAQVHLSLETAFSWGEGELAEVEEWWRELPDRACPALPCPDGGLCRLLTPEVAAQQPPGIKASLWQSPELPRPQASYCGLGIAKVCCLPPGGLAIPPFTRSQASIREQQLELFKLCVFFSSRAASSPPSPSFSWLKVSRAALISQPNPFLKGIEEKLGFHQSSPGFRD